MLHISSWVTLFTSSLGTSWELSLFIGTEAKRSGGVDPGGESELSYMTTASREAIALFSGNTGLSPSI